METIPPLIESLTGSEVSHKTPTTMPRTRSKQKAAPLDDDMYDEVDEFHQRRDQIALDQNGASSSSDDDHMSDTEEQVLSLQQPSTTNKDAAKFYASSSGSSSGSDDSDEDEDQFFNAPPPPDMEDSDHEDIRETSGKARSSKNDNTSGWGSKTRAFYGHDDLDDTADRDDSSVTLQEREARRLQQARTSKTDEADYGLGGDSSSSSDDEDDEDDKKGQRQGGASSSSESDGGHASKTGTRNKSGTTVVTRDHSDMTVEDKLAVVVKDSPELLGLLSDMKSKAIELEAMLQPMHASIMENPTSAGVSFLEVKLHTVRELLLVVVLSLCDLVHH